MRLALKEACHNDKGLTHQDDIMGAIYHVHGPKDSILICEFPSNLSLMQGSTNFFKEMNKLIPKLTKKIHKAKPN